MGTGTTLLYLNNLRLIELINPDVKDTTTSGVTLVVTNTMVDRMESVHYIVIMNPNIHSKLGNQ